MDVRWCYPSEVGWLADLYRYPDADEIEAQWLEQRLFQQIDDAAARVLARMLQLNPSPLDPADLTSWSLMIRSLMHRTPENLASTKAAAARIEDHLMKEIRENYTELRGENDPPDYETYEASLHDQERERAALRLLPSMITNRRIGTFMINMKWRVFNLPDECPHLLLSDDPVARTNGLAKSGGHLAMPLSPKRLLDGGVAKQHGKHCRDAEEKVSRSDESMDRGER